MKIPPGYKITPEILDLIAKIDANRIYLSSKTISPALKEKIQRVSILKSSLFSARIEGNPLTLQNIDTIQSDKQKKTEVFNILKAADYIDKNIKEGGRLSQKQILKLHLLATKNLPVQSGAFRKEVGAIFNTNGVAIYLSPPPSEINGLIQRLSVYINSELEKFPLVNALISHLVFEKIHPFLDGNGRVGRLLIFLILKIKGWNFGITIPFEEYLDNHKDQYYDWLDTGLVDANGYLEFMLTAFFEQTERLKEQIEEELVKKQILFLPPRQEEIFNIIKDHHIISFDMVRRRFLKVPERTLRYDLKKLKELGLIEKSGRTKASHYRVKSEIP